MRILFVNYEYPPLGGGGGLVNAWLAEELAKRHETTVLTSRAFDLPEREVRNGVEVIRSRTFLRKSRPTANLPSMASFLVSGTGRGFRLVRKRSFDIVNTHFAVPTGPVGAAIASFGHVPNVLSVHGGDLYDPSKWTSPHRHVLTRGLIRRLAHSAAAVVGQSHDTLEHFRQFYDTATHLDLIPLGIPRPAAVKGDRAALGLPGEATVLVTVGRLVARKGIAQLLRLVETFPDHVVHLVVIGEGPRAGELNRQARKLGIAEKITFTGFIPDSTKLEMLAAADIYISASQHEGFGLVFLEAMAQGLPVVCYDNGGQTDFLKTDESGSVVALNDFDGLVSAVRRLVENPAERQRISVANRATAETYFIDRCAERYESLFCNVIHEAAA